MPPEMRRLGLDVIDEVPWGTHLCLFYESTDDLLAATIPFLRAGLEHNELCIWVLSGPLGETEARAALIGAIPHAERRLAAGDIQIASQSGWYLEDGIFDPIRVLSALETKLAEALASGYTGLRLTASEDWSDAEIREKFDEYEQQLNTWTVGRRLIITCLYPIAKSSAIEVLAVVRAHQVGISRRHGQWEVVESLKLNQAKEGLRRLNEELERRVLERTRALEAANEALKEEVEDRRRAEEYVRLAVDTARLGIGDYAYDTDIVVLSDGFHSILGTDPATFRPSSADYFGLIHPEDRERIRASRKEPLPGPELSEIEYRILRPDGTVRWIASRGTVLLDDAGQPARILIVAIDVTERKEVETLLRQSEKRFQIVAHATSDVVWDWDLANGTLWWSEGITSLFGFAPVEVEETINWWRGHIHPDDRARVTSELDELIAGSGSAWNAEYRLARADGTYAYVLARGRVIRSDDGRATRMLGAVLDLTERRQTEAALRASEERFHVAFNASPFAIGISDLETGDLIDVNEAFLAAFGYDREEVIGRSADDLALWERPEDRADIVVRLEAGERVRDRETKLRTNTGERRLELVSAEIIEIDGRRCILTASTDITERRQLEEQLVQAQRMEAVGRLAAGVAHDFNNLLTVIGGYTDMARSRLATRDPAIHFLDEVRDAAQRAGGLTQQLLAFSRKQILEPKLLDLNDTVSRTEKMLRRLIGEDVELEVNLAPDAGTVYADPGQVEQVIMNLAVNARDAMPEGGRLTIETAKAEIADEPSDTAGKARPGRYVLVSVADTGTGMDEATKARLFEPFFTTKEPGKGTGLGLSTVFGIVAQSDGFIQVDSEPGRGTCFRIFLPSVDQKAHVAHDFGRKAAPSGHGETILLIEDEGAVRRLARLTLEDSGYHVLDAGTVNDALALAERHWSEIRLVITDVVMPGMSGPRLVGRLQKEFGPRRVLYVSGYTDDAISHHGVLDAGVELLNKPFTPDALARKVHEVLVRNPDSTTPERSQG